MKVLKAFGYLGVGCVIGFQCCIKLYKKGFEEFKNMKEATTLYFDTREEAENVLDEMRDVIVKYGFVTIADLYDMTGIINRNQKFYKFGWKDLSKARTRISKNYKIIIDFPEPELMF